MPTDVTADEPPSVPLRVALPEVDLRAKGPGSWCPSFSGAAIGLGIGVTITPPALLLAILSAGAGHGDYGLAKLLFPYSMLLTRLTGDTITLPLIALALTQFPVYGGLIGVYWNRRLAVFIAAILLPCHATAVLLCISGVIPNFS